MTNDAKQTLMENLLDTQQNLLGNGNYIPVELVIKEGNLNGYYSPATDKMYINKSGDHYNNFYSVTNTVIHEGTHAFQDFIVSNAGVINNNPELLMQKSIFKSNFGSGMYADTSNGYVFYRNNPLEVDAWKTGNDFQKSLEAILKK